MHSARRSAIQHCLTTTSEQIRLLQNKRDKSPDDTEALRTLRNEQTKLRLMRNELTVEDIARDRTIKVRENVCLFSDVFKITKWYYHTIYGVIGSF